MAKLIVNPTSSARREIALPRSLLSIGRDPSNDLVLPDAMVSRRHAVIELRSSQYYLRDCNSSNGSLVNGDRVSERSLRDGDLVAIGTARLLFREELELEEGGAKVVQHPSAPKLHCPNCNADYRKGDQFCRQCGATVLPVGPPKSVCPSCGTAVLLPARFCNACGRSLGDEVPAPPAAAAAPPEKPEPPADPQATKPELPGPAEPPRPSPTPAHGIASAAERLPAPQVAPEPPPPAPRPVPPPRAVPDRPAPARPARLDTFRQPERQPERLEPRPSASMTMLATPEPAGFGPRLVAGVIDAALTGVGEALLIGPVAWYWWTREIPRSPQDVSFVSILASLVAVIAGLLLGFAYYVYFWGVRGATPGKQLLELAVEGEDGRYPIGTGKALARVLGYMLSSATLGIGFLMIAFGGSGLHDRVAGTRVVRRTRA